ncbi:ATPase [Myxococcus stipitatus DSM 14675]|uniref:ATPase n=1 Tax=Myxococcus stipitatus (strain DSM 14675 / JCM 12634 / Mx s8) TaxID=1278073 RepID=L7UJI6_MYXSD|nr:ATP-binding protein [Myxococcus stipitatus]AGC48168.1 ATPase [Myxococcus stipitatus DSM 14675]
MKSRGDGTLKLRGGSRVANPEASPRPPRSLAASALSPVLAAVRANVERDTAGGPSVALPEPAPDSPLALLKERFGLSDFELSILACAAAVELLPGFGRSCGKAMGDPTALLPSVAMCVARMPGASFEAFSPQGALRRFRLVHLGEGDVLTGRSVTLSESVLHFLLGTPCRDARIEPRVRVVQSGAVLPPSRVALVGLVSDALRSASAPHFQLVASSAEEVRPLLAAVATSLGRELWEFSAWALPESPDERDELLWTCVRDARLCGALLFFDVSSVGDATRVRQVAELVSRTPDPLLLCGPEVVRPVGRTVVSLAIPRLLHEEAKSLWREALSSTALPGAEVDLGSLAARFQLSPDGIASAAQSLVHAGPSEPAQQTLWRACRLRSRVRLDDLAQRIEPEANWERLIVPEGELRTLRAIEAQVRHRALVFHEWGFSAQGERGTGTAAIFAGPSGTGKTMAAEVLAGALELDLYRIDLSAVVSKYIGETEKNLRRVFDAAEEGGAILLFDEADALFGKRTEVKDSHDRHSNVEVSYLLQRMESYQGLALLTTNLRKNIDLAFMRRIQFVVDFPFPDADLRERIWRAAFPERTPLEGVDPARLARLAVSGGNIKNIARNAAYLAAAEARPVGMQHLLDAARLEYAKLGQPLTPTEIRGWLP